MVILLFLGIAAIIGVLAWLAHQAQKARREALARVARDLGMRFSPEPRDWGGGFFSRGAPVAPFEVFERGHSRRSWNHLDGELRFRERTLGVTIADYRYKITRNSGKHRSTQTYQLSFLLVRLPFGDRLPGLRVRLEGFGDRIAAAVGFNDIDFESAEFSRRFHVSCGDRRFAYNLIDPRMIEFLLDRRPPQFELGGGLLLVTPADGLELWEPEAIAAACRWTHDFLAHWPEFVMNDLSSR